MGARSSLVSESWTQDLGYQSSSHRLQICFRNAVSYPKSLRLQAFEGLEALILEEEEDARTKSRFCRIP